MALAKDVEYNLEMKEQQVLSRRDKLNNTISLNSSILVLYLFLIV